MLRKPALIIALLPFLGSANVHAQAGFDQLLDDYAACAVDMMDATGNKVFDAQEARTTCSAQVDKIVMILSADLAMPIIEEVESILSESLAQ